VQTAAAAAGAFVQGKNIIMRPGLEAAYWGVDLEAEHRAWRRPMGCNCGMQGCSPGITAELWAAAGVYHFDNNAGGFQRITGPRARTELRLFDVPGLGNDSRVVLAAQYEHDRLRGSVGTGLVQMRIPLGRNKGKRTGQLRGLNRRMVAPIVRDMDVVTNAGALGVAEAAKVASNPNGGLISVITFVDGATVGPEAVIEGSRPRSIFITSGDAGVIMPGGTLDLNNGQVLLGGGGLQVTGCDSGQTAMFFAPGSRPLFNTGGDDGIRKARNNSLVGMDVTTSGDALIMQTNGSPVFEVIDSNFSSSGRRATALDFRVNGGGTVVADFVDSSFTTNSRNGGTINTISSFNSSQVTVNFRNTWIAARGSGDSAIDSISSNRSSTLIVNFDGVLATSQNGEGIDTIESFGTSTLTTNVRDNRVFSEDEGIDDVVSRGPSTLNLNIYDSIVSSRNNHALDEIAARGGSTFNINIERSSFMGGTMGSGDEVLNQLLAGNSSVLMANVSDSLFSGGGDSGHGVDEIVSQMNGQLTAVFDRTTFIGGSNGVGPINASGVDLVQASDDSTATVTFNDSLITGMGTSDAFDAIVSTENGVLNINFNDSTIGTSGTGEAFGRIRSSDTSTLTASVLNNTINGPMADAIDADSRNRSTLNAQFAGNTVASGARFFDFNLQQNGRSLFNVVDFPNLAVNNGGVSVTTAGVINDIPVLP